MKKLSKKSGFTLVECVVAMAILAIMTLMLAMMMNIIVHLRSDNQKVEEGVDEQVEYLVNEQNVATEKIDNGNIDFGDGIVIPGDKANKVYFNDPDANVQVGAVKYDFGAIITTTPVTEPDSTTTTTAPSNDIPINIGDKRVYGAIEVDSNGVKVTQTNITTTDNDYIMEWTFEFTATESSEIKALKAAFPIGAELISYKDTFNNCNVHCLGDRVVRLSPKNNVQNGSTQNINVTIEFKISKDNYVYYDEKNVQHPENFKHYFTEIENAEGVTSVNLTKVVGNNLKHNGEFMSLDDDRRDDLKDTNN